MIPARLLLSLVSALSEHIPSAKDALASRLTSTSTTSLSNSSGAATPDYNSALNGSAFEHVHTFAKRAAEQNRTEVIVFSCLIPILVVFSGIFSGLTLGYMSLDETQLNVLSVSGSP